VADDNSNIQKMVALALKDEGIDVVAVGNGEAAMRKIPDLRPDLVLADIFMPVRNGYEVCEFVKSDSRYMETPVVLLVGAFDPLDEQETQRVHADGVLKKPFVPPDPLINMVKALLAKSNGQKSVPMTAATSPRPAPPPQTTAAPPQTKPVTQQTMSATPAISSSQMGTSPAEKLVRRQGEMSPSDQAKLLAFITPPTQADPQPSKPEDPDEVVTAVRDPNLGDPFWATTAEPEEAEDKSEDHPADMIDMHSFGKDEPTVEEERESIFRPEANLLDGGDFGADLEVTTVSQNEPAPPQETHRAQTPPSEYDSPIVGQSGSAAPPPSFAPAETPAESFQFDPALTFVPANEEAPIEKGSDQAHSSVFAEPTLLEPGPNEPAAAPSWPSVTDSNDHTPAADEKPLHAHQHSELMETEWPPVPNHDAVLTAATEAARLAFSELDDVPDFGDSTESYNQRGGAAEQKDSTSTSVPANAVLANPEMVDAIVNRLLERMQPEIMEVVNREVLRPAIEAIVRREMKKS
jgi:CheY-like chemotaxis protein